MPFFAFIPVAVIPNSGWPGAFPVSFSEAVYAVAFISRTLLYRTTSPLEFLKFNTVPYSTTIFTGSRITVSLTCCLATSFPSSVTTLNSL